MIEIKGHEFKEITLRDSYNRRATQSQNKIVASLKRLGLTEDDVNIPMERMAMKNVQATASWYLDGYHMLYSYNGASKFAENLAMVFQVIEHFINELIDEKITLEEFSQLFVEEDDILEQRKEARKTLGVDEDSIDFEEMHKKFKKLSKEHHPDMPGGDTEKFKEINKAHKILKKELK